MQRRDGEWWALGQEEEHGGAREGVRVRGDHAEDEAAWRPSSVFRKGNQWNYNENRLVVTFKRTIKKALILDV